MINAKYQAAAGSIQGPRMGGPETRAALGLGRLPLGILFLYCTSLYISDIFGYTLKRYIQKGKSKILDLPLWDLLFGGSPKNDGMYTCIRP